MKPFTVPKQPDERWRRNYSRKPGPRKGQRHKGQFKKGHDPRRFSVSADRAKRMRPIEQACKESTEDALTVLRDLLTSECEKTRLAAAREILDRGHGRPVDRQAVLQISGQSGSGNPEDMKTADLLRIIADESSPDQGQVLEMQRDSGADE